MRIVLIHGYKASPSWGWFPWIERELRARGFDVLIPELPSPEEPDRDAWTTALVDACAPLTENDIIVAHSLGAPAALRMLEAAEARSTPHAVIMVSAPWMIKDERFRGFFMSELDFEVLMWRASKFYFLHAKDDTIIPLEHARRYAGALHGELVEAESGGHFQGTGEYPDILNLIMRAAETPVVYEPGQSLPDQFTDVR